MKISYAKLQKKYGGKYVLTDKPYGKIGYKLPAVQYVHSTKTVAIYEVKVSLRD